jgi:hypothetical protein
MADYDLIASIKSIIMGELFVAGHVIGHVTTNRIKDNDDGK